MEPDPAMGQGINGMPQPGQQLQQAASGLIDQATRTAEAQASTTMTRAGDALESVARAIRTVSEDLRENQPQIAGFADTAAEQVDSAATYLRERQAGEALQNIQEMARRQPVVVVGGGLMLGLLVGRLLRSGASEMQSDRSGGWRQGSHGATGYAGASEAGYGTRYGAGYDGGTGYAADAAAYGELGETDLATGPTAAPLATGSTATPLSGDLLDDETDAVDVDESLTGQQATTRRSR
jgi:hypothetical protein